MSRFGNYDEEPREDGKDISGLWNANAKRALTSRRGQAALRDLRDALLALPAKRLIEGALCTVGPEARLASSYSDWNRDDLRDLIAKQGEGVCAVGAYVWWKKVKAGMAPDQAFASLNTLAEFESAEWDTADAGKAAGLTMTLAYELAYRNDDTLGGLKPDQRYERFMAWLNKTIVPLPALPENPESEENPR